MRNLATASVLVLAACLNVGEAPTQAEPSQYAYEIPTASSPKDAADSSPPVVGDQSAPEFIVDAREIQLPKDDAPTAYTYKQVCGPNGCRIVRVPVQTASTTATASTSASSSSGVSSSAALPAASATFSGTRMQFQRGQPLRNIGRGIVRAGWRLSGGAIRARRRCRGCR